MMLYHYILYKNNKFKFIGIIIFEFIITLLNVVAIYNFYREDIKLPTILLFGILQMINIVVFILFRLTYRNEILLLKEDKIHIFITTTKAINKVLKNKLAQIFLFFMYQIPMSILMALIFKLPYQQVILLFINLVVSLLIFYAIIIKDMAVLNR